jgi:hypothetical protein
MPSGNLANFGGRANTAGRPKKQQEAAPTPQMAQAGLSLMGGGRGRNNSQDCNKGGCTRPATHVLVARDSHGDTDSAALCLEHSNSVARRAKAAGRQVGLTRLNEKSQALHEQLSGLSDMRQVAEEGLVRRGISASDALVGRTEIKPGRTGRPTEVFKDPRARHIQAVRKRRTDAELEANVNGIIRQREAGTYQGLAPTENTEAGRSYSEFQGSLMETVSRLPHINSGSLIGRGPDASATVKALNQAGVKTEGMGPDAIRDVGKFIGAPSIKNLPYSFTDRRTGKTHIR